MKRILFISIITLLIFAALFFAQTQNIVTFSYKEWTIQIQLWLIIFGFLVLLLAYKFLSGISRWVVSVPYRWTNFWRNRKEQRNQAQEHTLQQALQQLNQAKDAAELNQVWKSLSNRWRHDPLCANAYVRAALRLGDEAQVSDIIEWQLERQWQSNFVSYYGLLQQQAEKRLKKVHQWVAQYPRDADVLLSAGRLAKNAQEWGKAEQFLQQSITEKPSVPAYLELAYVQQQLNKPEQAWRHYQAAAQLQRFKEVE